MTAQSLKCVSVSQSLSQSKCCLVGQRHYLFGLYCSSQLYFKNALNFRTCSVGNKKKQNRTTHKDYYICFQLNQRESKTQDQWDQ